jgi:hypothetical protein
MFKTKTFWVLLTALLITMPLMYFSIRPVYLVEVVTQPTSEARAQVLSKQVLTRPDGNGVIFFDFRALVGSASGERLYLEIRPDTEPTFYRQGDGYRIINGVAEGVAQLNSPKWPVHQDENYTFRLIDASGAPWLEGAILARVHALSGTAPWLIGAIGLLASVLQILSAARSK